MTFRRIAIVGATLISGSVVVVSVDVLGQPSFWLKYVTFFGWACTIPASMWALNPYARDIKNPFSRFTVQIVGGLAVAMAIVFISIVVAVNFKFLIGGTN